MSAEFKPAVISIVFISAAMKQELEQRAEIERKEPFALAEEYVAANLDKVTARGLPEQELTEEETVSQNIRLTAKLNEVLNKVADDSAASRNKIIRACIQQALQQPPGKMYIN